MPEKHLTSYMNAPLGSLHKLHLHFLAFFPEIWAFCIDEIWYFFIIFFGKGAFTYDVRCFSGIFDLPTYPHQILHYNINLFSKIRWSLTCLPAQKSDVVCECSLSNWLIVQLYNKISLSNYLYVLSNFISLKLSNLITS